MALHECAHIVSLTHLGDSFDAELAGAYPDVAEEWRVEAIADALSDHWAATNPGGNVSPWFVPFTWEGKTYLDTFEDGYEKYFPFDSTTYAGDDALVERLTDAALAGNV